jgi:SSS family solute:Na+ symporter
MMMGFAVLGLFLVEKEFPDRAVFNQAASVVRAHPEFVAQHGDAVAKNEWDEALADIMRHPDVYPTLSTALSEPTMLGENWVTTLKLVSYEGTVNPERILPAVILYDIPMGFRGLLLIALLAASMSTFDTAVNMSAAYFTRDLYQRFWRPRARNRELMLMTYVYIVTAVGLAFLLSYQAQTINHIWGWLTMGLWAGMLAPGVLKFYWGRFNAGGVVTGTLFGMAAAVYELSDSSLNIWLQENVFPEAMNGELVGFVWIGLVGLIGAIIGTYVSPPNNPETLRHFYLTTRPFGLWGEQKRQLRPEVRRQITREHTYDLISLPFAVGWQVSLFLLPMLALIGNWAAFWWSLAIFVISLLGLYIFWYRNLPPASAGVLNRPEDYA